MRRSRAGWLGLAAAAVLAVPVGLVGLAVPAAPAYGSGPAGDWKQADHDASANRANTTETTITPANVGQVGWRRGLVAAPPDNEDCPVGWSAPVLANGRSYATGADRLVVSDLATGATVWQRRLSPAPVGETSRVYAISGGRVFVGSLDCFSSSDPSGRVRAFDAVTGAQLWSASVDGLRGLAVSGDRVVAVGYTAGAAYTDFQVLSASTGALVWRPALGEGCAPAANPIVVHDRVYYRGCEDTRLVAARLTDGAVAWTRATGDVPVRGDAVGTTAKHLYAGTTVLNPATGATRFPLAGATRVHAVDGTRVYATCGTVFCAFTRATGARLWTSTEPSDTDWWESEPALAGALLYTPRGAVLDAATGTPVARLWLGEARGLSVGNGYVAVVVDDRVLDLYGLPGS